MKMVAANETTLSELLEMLDRDPAEEIFLTNSGKPKFKLVSIDKLAPTKPKIPRDKLFGCGKDILNLPPDFDEVFDAMDAEIWREVADSYEVNK